MLIKSEKIIIVGQSGSGKDFLLRELSKKGLIPSIKITTRPKRINEVDGLNYKFLTNTEFNNQNLIVEQSFINDKGDLWKYGISKNDFDNSQIFIMTPDELSQLKISNRKRAFVVYLDIDRGIRERRILDRIDNNDSVIRRLNADEIDFKDFSNYDLKITDPVFDVDMILSLMS